MTAKPAGIDMERNYVSVTLCISKRFLPLFGVVGNAKFAQLCHFHRVECGNTVGPNTGLLASLLWHCPHSMQCRVYASMHISGVRLSVPAWGTAANFAAAVARPVEDIDRLLHSAQ